MRLQANRQRGWALSEHGAESILVLLAVMLQLPVVHWSKCQRKARRLAKNLLVTTKQFRTPQRIDEFPVFLDFVSARLGGVDCDWVQVEALLLPNLGEAAANVTKNKDRSAAYVVRAEGEHVCASSLQTFYHHCTHSLEKLVT